MRTDTSGAPECFAAFASASATIAFAVSRVRSSIRSTSPSIETRAAVQLEEDLPDLFQIVADRVLDLLQGLEDGLRFRADPVLEPLELEDRARHGLREPVVDVDRPVRALGQQQGIDRMGHGRMHASSGSQRGA